MQVLLKFFSEGHRTLELGTQSSRLGCKMIKHERNQLHSVRSRIVVLKNSL